MNYQYLYLALNVVLLTHSVFAFRNAEASDPWYCGRKLNLAFIAVFAALTVRDVLRLV